MRRVLLAVAMLLAFVGVSGVAQAEPSTPQPKASSYVVRDCISCHGTNATTAAVDPISLATLQATANAKTSAPEGTLAPLLDRSSTVTAAQAATFAANMSKVKQVDTSKIKWQLVNAPSGHTPYGGSQYSAYLSLASPPGVASCTSALSVNATSGAQYVYSAGHCVLNLSGTAPQMPASNGKTWYPKTNCVTAGCPTPNGTLGSNGHAGSVFDGRGDATFIRANLAWGGTGLRREVGTFDARSSVEVEFAGNPLQGESASCSCGQQRKLIRGIVSSASAPLQNIGNATVGNLAILQSNPATEGCPIPGDSGSSVITGDHGVIGTVSAISNDGQTCLILFDRAGTSMSRVNVFAAPAP